MKLVSVAAATLVIALAASAADARPRHWHRGYNGGAAAVGLGALGAIAIGSAIIANTRPAYAEPGMVRICRLAPRVNRYGEVIGQRRVCRYEYE